MAASRTMEPSGPVNFTRLTSQGDHVTDDYSVRTKLQPHQQRVGDKLEASGGVLVAHGMGSGKSLSSIAAAKRLGLPVDAVVPAPLVQNYLKELDKHVGGRENFPDLRLRSYEAAAKGGEGAVDPERLVVLDEAHRARNPGTSFNRLAREAGRARARLLLTGTPDFNQPEDLAVLLNAARGDQALPEEAGKFRRQFVGHRSVKPGFMLRLLGVPAAQVPQLKNREKLVDLASGYVDTHPSGGEDYPSRTDESIDVPMSDKQREIYRYHEGTLPWLMRMKVRAGLPMPKNESGQLNAFAGGLRQSSNTPRPYVADMTDEEEAEYSSKLRRAAEEVAKAEGPAVAYSNYLEGGLLPYQRMLKAKGLDAEVFHGGLTAAQKQSLVDRYNAGKLKALLLSSAGSEGLDLKNTRLMQILEPHWNPSKTDQVIARAIRYGSHSALPEDQRNVRVQQFHAVHPKGFLNRLGIKPDVTIDKYLQDRSDEKAEMHRQIMDALEEASKRGPLTHA